MGTVKTFEELIVWQKARQFCKELYAVITQGSFAKDYELRSQIDRSAGSVMDNIAEGFERDGRLEFIQFLSIAKASSGEVKSQLYRALDRKHIKEEDFDQLYSAIQVIGKMLGSFINYLRKNETKGLKYKVTEPKLSFKKNDLNELFCFNKKLETRNEKL